MKRINKILVHNYFKLTEPMSWLAWAIRKATGKHYNHSGLVVLVNDSFVIIHAVYPRVEIKNYEKWLKEKERDIKLIPVDVHNFHETQQKAIDQVGKKYDLINLLFLMPVYLLTGKWIGSKSSDRLQCYELCAYVLGEKDSYRAKPYLKTK